MICPQPEFTPSTGPGFNQTKGKHSLPLTTIFVVFASKDGEVARVQHPPAQEQRPDECYTHHQDDLQSFVRGREQRRKHSERIEGENAQPMDEAKAVCTVDVANAGWRMQTAFIQHSQPHSSGGAQSLHARGLEASTGFNVGDQIQQRYCVGIETS